mmetsp:Transcript_23432/g.26014  ORF Transcript_23432/g.26014 Transcript_23432/m.26014 type:complete len:274 (+) Transcript_23432:16-837(+)
MRVSRILRNSMLDNQPPAPPGALKSIPKYINIARTIPHPHARYPLKVGARTRVCFIGIGSYVYPRSRHSIGHYVADLFTKDHNLSWVDDQKNCLQYAETPDYVLSRSMYHSMRDLERTHRGAFSKYSDQTKSRNVWLVHDHSIPLGEVLISNGTTHVNKSLQARAERSDTGGAFGKDGVVYLNIGVGQGKNHLNPDHVMDSYQMYEHHWDKLFLYNKFPPLELQFIHDVVYPNVREAMYQLIYADKDFTKQGTTEPKAFVGQRERDWTTHMGV